jgi:hypothetical protein
VLSGRTSCPPVAICGIGTAHEFKKKLNSEIFGAQELYILSTK